MARQKLGQHFLASEKALTRIAEAACGSHTPLAIEIGPGRGALTQHLLARADRVVAIELDSGLVPELRSRWPLLEVIEGDALEVDSTQWGAGVLAGNLPYYVSTPIISRFLSHPGSLTHAVFLIQREVAERITAKPGTRDYGYFSVECQLLAEAEYLFTVPPGAFRPPPKVDSAVIRFTPKPRIENADAILAFASTCFRQKRKTLRNNLAEAYSKAVLDLQPEISKRAEQLSIAELIQLFRRLNER